MRWWWWGGRVQLKRQARQVRARLGDRVEPGGNGRGRGGAIQELGRPRARARRRRRWLLLGAAVVLSVGLGARKCKPVQRLTGEEYSQARADLLTACQINNCSPEQLEGLLHQLEAMARLELDEEPRR